MQSYRIRPRFHAEAVAQRGVGSVLLLALCLLLTLCPARAQEFRATISGVVTNQQHKPVAKARIVATAIDTNVKRETITSKGGEYSLPDLAPGKYEIEVVAHSFKRFVRKGISLDASAHPTLNFIMTPGSMSETVEITADVSMTGSADASTGQNLGTGQVNNLPNDGASPVMLSLVAVGVSGTGAPGQSQPYGTKNQSLISMAGTPTQTSEIQMDGSPVNEWRMMVAYNPPFSIVQQVHTYAFQSDAAYGHTGGGILNQVTKGGTNGFHGSAYEFNQVSALKANSYFNNRSGKRKPVTRYNQYGLNAGGPIMIPHIYDGRNKLFWNFAWEGVRDIQALPGYITVPTAAERTGDFSALLNAGSNFQIYNPATATQNAQGIITRQPFANNMVTGWYPGTVNGLNPVALNYLKYYPLPNTTGNADGLDNFFANFTVPDSYDNEIGRLDFSPVKRDQIIFTFRHTNYLKPLNYDYAENIAMGTTNHRGNWGSMLDNVYTINPTTVVDVRVNWLHFVESLTPPSLGFDATQLGYPSNLGASSAYKQMPAINFGSSCTDDGSSVTYQCIGQGASSGSTFVASSYTSVDNYQFFGDISKTFAKHNVKAGVDVRQSRRYQTTWSDADGAFNFASDFTKSASNGTASPLGQDLAAFLLGLPSSGDLQTNAFAAIRSNYLGVFVQDNWRVSSNLTINAGVRYEHDFPMTERHNRSVSGFDTTDPNPVATAAVAAYAKSPISLLPASSFAVPGGLTFPTTSNPHIFNTPEHLFSPRLGFNWTPQVLDAKTVVRGGFGLFVFPIIVTQNMNQEGFTQTTPFVATNNNYLTWANTLSNPFPGGIPAPQGATAGLATNNGRAISFFDPQQKNGYSERWQLQLQRPVGKDTAVEIGYIGNHAVRLQVTDTQLNDIPAQYQSRLTTRDTTLISALTASVPNPFAGLLPGTSLNGSTVSAYQLLVPFPQFPQSSSTTGGVDEQDMNTGSSNFESLNLRADHRLSHGFYLTSNYTWSHLIEETTKLNNVDTKFEKRTASYDHTHHFSLAGTYELPFGKGKLVPVHSNVLEKVVGDWSVNGAYTFQSGVPVVWGNVIYNGGPLHWNARNTTTTAFDTTQFNTNSKQQLQYNIRTFPSIIGKYRQDAVNTVNASVFKGVALSHFAVLQLRFESYNLLNHATFNAPNVSPTSSGFGTITGQYNQPRSIQMSGRVIW